ncbi:hypothetical protein KR222_004728 [Zaprionus bogoriensis]|nr:hypothetical protein KR222_004728 [Zaprionus bogoriensis]
MGNRTGRIRLKSEDADALAEAEESLTIVPLPPAFDRSMPEQWFADIEDHCEKFDIRSDAAKCELVMEELDWDLQQLLEDLRLCSAPSEQSAERQYERLKGIILQTLNASRV